MHSRSQRSAGSVESNHSRVCSTQHVRVPVDSGPNILSPVRFEHDSTCLDYTVSHFKTQGNPRGITPPQRRFIQRIEYHYNERLNCLPFDDERIRSSIIDHVPSPGTYDGRPSEDYFEEWVMKLIGWMSLAGLCSTSNTGSLDRHRRITIGCLLKGAAQRWHCSEIWRGNEAYCNMDSLTFLCELYLRFVPVRAYIDAHLAFERAKYEPKDGALGLYLELTRHAERMWEHPDDVSIHSRLHHALPKHVVSKIFQLGASDVLFSGTSHDLMETAREAELLIEEADLLAELGVRVRRPTDNNAASGHDRTRTR